MVSCSVVDTDARRSGVGDEEELDIKSEECATRARHITHCRDDHQPVVEAKSLDHSHADVAPQQTGCHGCRDKDNVDCKQLGASVGDGHGVDSIEALGVCSRSKEPRRDASDARGDIVHLRRGSA